MINRPLILFGATIAFAGSALAVQIEVNEFKTLVGSPAVDAWYKTDVRIGGTATIDNLTGAGGVLESGQPLPTGAAHLSTDSTGSSKAEVGTFADYGLASSFLADVDLAFKYYKAANTTHPAPAPSLKLTVYNPAGLGDNFGQLIFEPYWNGTVTPDSWNSVAIDETTGAGADGTGGWWWSGGFEISSGAGGPPVRSLSEWLSAFQTSDPTDFGAARVTGVSVGVGSNNPGQNTYFDGVMIKTGNIDKTYNFQAASVPDAGTSASLLGLGAAALLGIRRRLQG